MYGGLVSVLMTPTPEISNIGTDDDAKPMAAKYLTKWRPGFIGRNNDTKEDSESKLITGAEGQNGVPVTA